MKAHQNILVLQALIFCCSSLFAYSHAATKSYPNGSVTYVKASEAELNLSEYETIKFNGIGRSINGGAILNKNALSSLTRSGFVGFSGNSVSRKSWEMSASGGAIYNGDASSFVLSHNEDVLFNSNSGAARGSCGASDGGAIYNSGDEFALTENGKVSFVDNSAAADVDELSSFSEACGGAVFNYSTFKLNKNGEVRFSGNSLHVRNINPSAMAVHATGAAICNYGDFELKGNGDVVFSNNTASIIACGDSPFSYASGGAIYNSGVFTLKGNGDVLFEKNAEVTNGSYQLRSIYSEYGSLNLTATEDKSILFKDCISAGGTVNLNRDGTGDIIFTGAFTEADLREVKGGVDGTAEEILNSRTSVIDTGATLYGGRLVVENEAILKVNNLSVAEGASVVVNDGTLALNNGNATITTASGAETAVMVGTSLGESSLSGADAEHRGTVDGAHIDIAEGLNFTMQHLVLGATTRISDAPATVQLDDVAAELVLGGNASLTGSEELLAGTQLMQTGNPEVILTLTGNATVQLLEADTFDSVTLSGNSLVLELTEMPKDVLDGADFLGVSFTSGTGYAIFGEALSVTLNLNGVYITSGYLAMDADKATTIYFATPEPATATLSLLALTALAARRRRK